MDRSDQDEESIFNVARLFSDSEKLSAYLDLACDSSPALRHRVERLLNAACPADAFFDRQSVGLPRINIPSGTQILESSAETSDLLSGRYKLIEKIGEGGCGVVYIAEQEEPIRRQVALKVIKAGMDTKNVIARFEAERQALAMMDHPNIAKVHDGGTTEHGRPYFVMEFVRGVRITDYCDQKNLSIQDRLNLFLQVCDAVQHAHQKGIIHRDLKPSNILVQSLSPTSSETLSESSRLSQWSRHSPLLKVIDFGIAKAIEGKLTDDTVHTALHQFIGTPAYMSPEQAQMSPDIDTRTDIYSLGVLLYELLTGRPPFDNHELLTAGLDEMRRIIREVEPLRPSQSRKSQIKNQKSKIPSDLDSIALKCLEKDRSHRYETASALASDIKRYLNSEPILARPPTVSYRVKKFIARHKVPVLATSITILALLTASIVSALQALRATRAQRAAREQTDRALASEARANREAETAKAIKNFLTEQLLSANPYVQPAIDPAHRRVLLEQVAQNIEGKFAQQPEVEDEIRFALGVGFIGVADIKNALRQAERVLALRRERLGNTHEDTIEMMAYVAMDYLVLDQKAQAEKLLHEAAPHIPSSGPLSRGAAVALFAHARLLRADHKLIEAMNLYRRCLPDLIRTLGPTDDRVIVAMWDVAITAQEANLLDEADRRWTEGIRHFEQALSPDHPATARFLNGKSYHLLERGEWPEAMKLLERVLRIYQGTFGTNHNHTLDAEDLLARAYEQKGETNTAAKIYQSTFPRWVKHFPRESAFNHCEIIAEFFERHGHLSQAQLVRDEVKRFREKAP